MTQSKDLHPATKAKVQSMQSGVDGDKVFPSDTKIEVSGMEKLRQRLTQKPVFDGKEEYKLDNLSKCVKNDIAVETRWAYCKRQNDGSINYGRLQQLEFQGYVRITPADLKDGVNIDLVRPSTDGENIAMMCLKEQFDARKERQRLQHNELLEANFKKTQEDLGASTHKAELTVKSVNHI